MTKAVQFLLAGAALMRIAVPLNNASAQPDIVGGPRYCLDSLDTFRDQLEREFRDHPTWSSIDLAQEPELQAPARAVVRGCRPWILETNISQLARG